jgi:hypothetical protein
MAGPEGVSAWEKDKRAKQSRKHNEAGVKSRFMDSSSLTHEALALASLMHL